MERQGDELHIETDEARGGSTPNIVRWILGISLLAAIILLSIIWMTGAATQNDEDSNVSVDAQIGAEDASDGTDSIVGENADEMETAPAGGTESGGTSDIQN